MRAETIRRLLVFGVCAVGVSALYLVPSLTHAPARLAQPSRPDDSPTPVGVPTAPAPVSASPASRSVDVQAGPSASPTLTVITVRASEQTSDLPRRSGSTPYPPGPVRDSTPPEPVTSVRLDSATEDTATLSWRRAGDDVGVTAYRVWLNGYVVSTTTQTSATVRWFNDDSAQQIVQVRAVDAAGNQSTEAASLLASRPTPTPSATTTDEPSPTPTPSASSESAPDVALAPTQNTSETPR